MRVCVPTLDDAGLDAAVSPHFGRAPSFTIYDRETGAVEVLDNDSHHYGGTGSPPALVAGGGADVVCCGNIGADAAEKFDAMDIDVYSDATGTVQEALEQFDAGALTDCGRTGDCGHDHDH